jgi:hypothetical protein
LFPDFIRRELEKFGSHFFHFVAVCQQEKKIFNFKLQHVLHYELFE